MGARDDNSSAPPRPAPREPGVPCPQLPWHLGQGASRHSHSHSGSTSPGRGTLRRASTGLCSRKWGRARHGRGRSQPSLQGMTRGGCGAPRMVARLQPSHPRGACSPLALWPHQHHVWSAPQCDAAASPPMGTTRLASDCSAKGHRDCGGEPPLPLWLSCCPCPTLVPGAGQPGTPAAIAQLPIAAVSVAPAPPELLPGWHNCGGP